MVPPGLTGWAQVNLPYGDSVDAARAKLEYDLYYVKHRSVTFDLAIVLRTADRHEDAASAARDAVRLWELKGNTVSAAHTRADFGIR